MENVAAIDIGSNAIRLVIGEFDQASQTLRLLRKLREPLRLGRDVFANGSISDKTMSQAVEVFSKFRQLIDAYSVKNSRAVATSALREASNQDSFIRRIKSDAGIQISVIDALEEARLIHEAVAAQVNLHHKLAILLDIGGGSVEITISSNGKIRATESFSLGTVRLLQKLDELKLKEKHLKTWINENFQSVADLIAKHTRQEKVDLCIGTGGNLEFLGKLRVQILDKDSTFSLRPKELGQILDAIMAVPVKDRGDRFRMRPDRADVIVPAGIVAHAVLEVAGTHRMLIPAVGLKDGILVDLIKSKNVRVVMT
jgi:exopolyphosphatase/guanosine-5'-triphosphate,3'-diphosphate pyrophosphatase